jgi:hypothetical protein
MARSLYGDACSGQQTARELSRWASMCGSALCSAVQPSMRLCKAQTGSALTILFNSVVEMFEGPTSTAKRADLFSMPLRHSSAIPRTGASNLRSLVGGALKSYIRPAHRVQSMHLYTQLFAQQLQNALISGEMCTGARCAVLYVLCELS